MEIHKVQEKSEQIFLVQPKAHQLIFLDTNKMVPTDPLRLIAFFEQCQVADKAAGVLEKIAKDKKQPQDKKTAHLPAARSHELSSQKYCCHKYCEYHDATNSTTTTKSPSRKSAPQLSSVQL
jgi:hypothetical protein